MRSRRRVHLTLGVVMTGSLIVAPGAPVGSSSEACDQRPLTFREPLWVDQTYGFEPGIEIDSQGTVFVTAPHFALLTGNGAEGPRLASGVWRSTDDGKTFQEVSGPAAGATRYAYALEGDLAVDGQDRLYFADTWLADNHLSRYSDHGATLDFWRPAVASAEPVDDRPWLAAHGDGYVYYLGNVGLTALHGRLTVHRSTDGGLTFDPVGYRFPASGWGFIDADPNGPYVYMFADSDELGALTMWVSDDRGATWSSSYVSDYRFGRDVQGFPTVAVSPVDGSVYALWSDGSARIYLARSTDHGGSWDVHDVTPFSGQFLYPWVTVGPSGDVGIVFSADPHAFEGPIWYVYGMVWRPDAGCVLDPGDPGSVCTGPAASYGRLQEEPTGEAYSQRDFFQVELSPDNALNVPYTVPHTDGISTRVMYTRQTSGPNLDGTPFCGMVGAP